MEPIPIKKLGNERARYGHTRAFAAFLYEVSEVPIYLADEELDWDAYEICVKWCKENGIRAISDPRTESCLKRNMKCCDTKVVKKCNAI